jgi:hypothetical protein
MACERKYVCLISLYTVAFVTVVVSLAIRIPADAHFATLTRPLVIAANASSTSRTLYAVNQSSATRGSISVYDIDRGHSLLKTIPTVSNVDDVNTFPRRDIQQPSTGVD